MSDDELIEMSFKLQDTFPTWSIRTLVNVLMAADDYSRIGFERYKAIITVQG